ncbi:MAG: hypothetical protein DWH81_03210 [Planctomycetota bacterium]|nr:MAG: hypothetical protein DWH81_03210 [Planctomycetota bacterium]
MNGLSIHWPQQTVIIDHGCLNQIEIGERDSARLHDESTGAMLTLMTVWPGLLIVAGGGLLVRSG